MGKYFFVDSEINNKNQICDLGAISDDGAEFHNASLENFKFFVKEAEYVVGHNIVRHDIKYIENLLPSHCKIIDTLFWSPILFPNKPYHKLVKDDKIYSEDVNNPLSDSIKCKNLFYDEVSKFNSLSEDLRNIFGELLFRYKEFGGFLESVSWNHHFFTNLKILIKNTFYGLICSNSNLDKLIKEYPIELAYSLALLTADDKKSITPGWILNTFPNVKIVTDELRSKNCRDPKCPYCSVTFAPKTKLKEFFGYDEFRKFDGENLQEKAVNFALDSKSLLTIFPTGGGKSLTFQLPALIEGESIRGLTIVISPLQSLMKDQIDNLEKKNIVGGATINGLLSPIERAENIELVKNGMASILYIAPESLRSKTVENLLLSREISRIVVDEAHCFSSWGHEFRVDYLFIADFIKEIQEKKLEKPIPISCFTATAKPKVISDICDYFKNNLNLDLNILASSSNRKNLTYKVLYQQDENEKYLTLRELLNEKKCSTIVYVARVKDTLRLAEKLTKDGIPSVAFNGQMERAEKIKNQNLFMNNEIQVIVATSAFGMGVDKADVKLVIHYDISDSIENYVQEAGRAGRDQSIQAECFILYNENDLDKHFLLLNQTKITLNEIRQVWSAIKMMTTKSRKSFCASGLEIARRAGWDENVKDIETRVRTALCALEQSGYIKRKFNSPRVFATGVLARNYVEAAEKIDSSKLFLDEKEKEYAKRIIKKIISARAISKVDGDAESRVDYISDSLGIPRMDVEESINKMRQEKILADSMDLNAYIKKSEENKTTKTILRFAKLERFMVENVFCTNGKLDLKELNDKALKSGIKDATVKNIRTILFYWNLKDLIKYSRENNIYQISLKIDEFALKKRVERKLDLSIRIANQLFAIANKTNEDEELVQFSLLSLMNCLSSELTLLDSDITVDEKDVEEALLYLSKIGAVNLEGGFIVLYNSLNIERIITDNHIQYKNEDYKELSNYYKMKTQQIHMVGEFANKMLKNNDEALLYVQDYFSLDYDSFIKKYFKGKQRIGEITRNITPEKYNTLFGNLSETQKEIIDDDDSQYICVIAGPGSGKTRVLVHKLASLLLLEDIKSEQLLMLTFSRSAARLFKSRLEEIVGSAVNYVDIKTFHSYCFDLLGKIGNEDEFDDVVKVATEMINNGEVEEEKIAKAVLVIDEAQDMDEDEYNLIRAIADRNPDIKIIAVGDDDQNIFEFRGSDSKYLESFSNLYSAKKYEMVENYRSKKNIVSFSNDYIKTIKKRIKTKDIVSMSNEDGSVTITEYTSENIEIPVCNDLLSRNPNGTTAILTLTNESALKIVGILTKCGIKAKLIQSDENVNLYNLVEFRFFVKEISKCNSPVIDKTVWDKAKTSLKDKYGVSSIFDIVIKVIETFEAENTFLYKNDFVSFIKESNFSDFETFANDEIVVSTIHKSKGREFDNVFMLLDSHTYYSDEQKRKVYVGLTRAKSNLFVHIYGKGLEAFSKLNYLTYKVDKKRYLEPADMEIQLGYHDVILSYFKSYKERILGLRSGNLLDSENDYLKDSTNKRILKFSNKFCTDNFKSLLERGYKVVRSEIRYILAWKNKDEPDSPEIAVLLPNIYLKKENVDAEKFLNESETCAPKLIKSGVTYDSEKNVPNVKMYFSKIPNKNLIDLNSEERKEIMKTPLFIELKEFRLMAAQSQKVPPYVIFYDDTLLDIVLKRPKNKEELLEIYGFGEKKKIKYGDKVVEIILKYLS